MAKLFQDSALDLLDDARETSVKRIRRSLFNMANIEDEPPATSTSTNRVKQSCENLFPDNTAEDRIRTMMVLYKHNTDPVVEIHKQDLFYYGIIDLIPSSSTKIKDVVSDMDLAEIIGLTNKIVSRGRTFYNTDGAPYQDVKNFVAHILGQTQNDRERRYAIKEARSEIRQNRDETSKWEKTTIKTRRTFN
ncbi:hypothetical protein [Parasitella parasitica]|uniref:Uncharacterized protein n=1 Tax=Parasitella parasitica TaxID=35722 RepID=A0A0B7MWA8_9FUNG|nr:hypothetical protein [Parasitella parasitica]